MSASGAEIFKSLLSPNEETHLRGLRPTQKFFEASNRILQVHFVFILNSPLLFNTFLTVFLSFCRVPTFSPWLSRKWQLWFTESDTRPVPFISYMKKSTPSWNGPGISIAMRWSGCRFFTIPSLTNWRLSGSPWRGPSWRSSYERPRSRIFSKGSSS